MPQSSPSPVQQSRQPTVQKTSQPALQLSVPRVLAGALAAASAAVASSWLGVAGTVFGAVFFSVLATVATTVYSHSLERSQQVIKETLPIRPPRRWTDRGQSDDPETIELSTKAAAPQRPPINWATVLVSCLATLVLGFGMLTGFELLTGKSAAELTGSSSQRGTTLGSLVSGGHGDSPHSTPAGPGARSGSGSTTTLPVTTSPGTTAPTTTQPTSPTTTGPTSTGPTSPTTTGPTTTTPTSTQTTTAP